MTIDFASLRKNKGRNFEALQKKLENTGQGGKQGDPRLWKPQANKDDVAECIIRFLPIPYVDRVLVEEGKIDSADLTPTAKIISHYFKGSTGQYYVENSPATFGDPCPVAQLNSDEWAQGEANGEPDDSKDGPNPMKTRVRTRRRNTAYYANVYVIKDKNNPENEGQVKLYNFGATVMKLLEAAANPKFESEKPFDPFDLFEGADLIMNITYEEKKINGRDAKVPNFDNVKWATPAPAFDGDEARMEEVWKQEHSIAEFYDRNKFKSFDELQAKLYKVMGMTENGNSQLTAQSHQEKMDDHGSAPANEPAAKAAQSAEEAMEPSPAPQAQASDNTLDDFEAMMQELEIES